MASSNYIHARHGQVTGTESSELLHIYMCTYIYITIHRAMYPAARLTVHTITDRPADPSATDACHHPHGPTGPCLITHLITTSQWP
jgi:hypothetical protein